MQILAQLSPVHCGNIDEPVVVIACNPIVVVIPDAGLPTEGPRRFWRHMKSSSWNH